MKKLLIAALCAVLAGCSSEAQKAEEELDIVLEGTSNRNERCAAARKAQDAWLKAGEKEQYAIASLRADGICGL